MTMIHVARAGNKSWFVRMRAPGIFVCACCMHLSVIGGSSLGVSMHGLVVTSAFHEREHIRRLA
jgi:hypothetical protein